MRWEYLERNLPYMTEKFVCFASVNGNSRTYLRWVNDRCADKTSVDTTVGYGKRTACHIIYWDAAVICLLAKRVDGLLNLCEIQMICSSDHWNNEALKLQEHEFLEIFDHDPPMRKDNMLQKTMCKRQHAEKTTCFTLAVPTAILMST